MVEVHFELTNCCPLNCKHCSSNANTLSPIYAVNNMEIVNFINQIEDDEIKVIFTGGEPLLYGIPELAGLFRILNAIENKRILLGLFTTGVVDNNGTLRFISDKEIDILKKSGLQLTYFSIYSRIKEIHEYITNAETFELTINTLLKLIKQGVTVNVNYVLSKFSVFNEVMNDFEFFNNLGVNEIRVLRLIKHGRAIENWEEVGISENNQFKIIKRMLRNSKYNLSLSGMPQLINCQGFEDNFCYAGLRKFYVDINGDIFPCACVKNNKKFKQGNIYNGYDLTQFNVRRVYCLADNKYNYEK